jgi:hypothetical protein
MEDTNVGAVYLHDKNHHLSFVAPEKHLALQFNSKKDALNFLKHHKMDVNLWEIEKI